MTRVLAELDDVPECNSYMFQQLPRRVWQLVGYVTPLFDREVRDCSSEVGMCLVPIQGFGELLTKLLIAIH
jgi:hypothetical protein